jgi:rod shape-determining protein MreC
MKTLNLIALSVFIALTTAVITLDTPTTQRLRQRVLGWFSPFIHASATVGDRTMDAMTENLDPAELAKQNEKLTLEVQRLKILAQRHEDLLQENASLREMVGYKQRARFRNLIAARVIKRSAATWWGSLMIDKGALDGITIDSAVVTDVGLVGKVVRVDDSIAEVVLLTDEQCRVATVIEGTREKGILSGERGDNEAMPDLRLKFLTPNAPITPGMNVMSSGDGGVFPAKLVLGKVKIFENREISGEALIEPAVDFERLTDVFVVGAEKAVPVAEPIQ